MATERLLLLVSNNKTGEMMMKHVIKVAVVAMALLTSRCALSETTLVLDLEDQYNSKAREIQDFVRNGATRQDLHKSMGKFRQALNRIHKSRNGLEKSEATARFVNMRIEQTGQYLDWVSRLYDLNNDFMEVMDRLLKEYAKDAKSDKTGRSDPKVQLMAQQVIRANAIGINAVLNSGVLDPKDGGVIRNLLQNSQRSLQKINRKRGEPLQKLAKMREWQNVIIGNMMTMEKMQKRFVERLQLLSEVNLNTRFKSVTRETNRVLSEIGIFSEEFIRLDEGIDRETEALLYEDDEVADYSPASSASDWNALVREMDESHFGEAPVQGGQ